jgi:hypothetical protein
VVGVGLQVKHQRGWSGTAVRSISVIGVELQFGISVVGVELQLGSSVIGVDLQLEAAVCLQRSYS